MLNATNRKGGGRAQAPKLEASLFEYLLTGDLDQASEARAARGLPLLVLFREVELRPLWRTHRAEILAEATSRGVEAWGLSLDRAPISSGCDHEATLASDRAL